MVYRYIMVYSLINGVRWVSVLGLFRGSGFRA